MVAENGPRFRGSLVAAGNDTSGGDLAIAGLHDRLSYSVGYYEFQTAGFRDNNDVDQRISNAFMQFRPSSRTSLQAELRSADTESGDLALSFYRDRYSPLMRIREETDAVRLGLRQDLSARDTLLASVIYQDFDGVTSVGDRIRPARPRPRLQRGRAGDPQCRSLAPAERLHLRAARHRGGDAASGAYAGAAVRDGGNDARRRRLEPEGRVRIRARRRHSESHADRRRERGLHRRRRGRQRRAESEARHRMARRANVSPCEPRYSRRSRDRSPHPGKHRSRGSSRFRSPGSINSYSPRTAISHESTEPAWTSRSRTAFSRAQRSRAASSKDRCGFVGSDAGDFQASGSETWQRAYFYWAPNDQLSFNAQYQYDRLNNAEERLFGFTHMRIQRLPLEVRYFAAAGLSVGVRASLVHQDGSFVTPVTGPLDEFAPGEDRFWTVDASLGYRLPNRRGVLSFNVNNLFDEEFQFQDIDRENPSIMPDRLAYLRFTLAFE